MTKDNILAFCKQFETKHDDFTLTVRFGHVLVHDKDLSAVAYDDEQGIADMLAYLCRSGWTANEVEGKLLGCHRDQETILLGAGGQIIWQFGPFQDISDLDKAYLGFVESLFEELKRRGQVLIATGHQPVTDAAHIATVPDPGWTALMEKVGDNAAFADYLKCAAFNEVSFQYAHIDNFEKRFQAAAIIQPALAAFFDNTAWVHGKANEQVVYNLNQLTKADRAYYHVDGTLGEVFKYDDYADFLLAVPNVLSNADVAETTRYSFPMVGMTENGLTIRNIDSVPYPLNIAYVMMVNAILYNPDHITAIQKMIEELHEDKLLDARQGVLEKGLAGKIGEGNIFDMVKDLFFMILLTVEPKDQQYLQPLDSLIFKEVRPRVVGAKQFSNMLGV